MSIIWILRFLNKTLAVILASLEISPDEVGATFSTLKLDSSHECINNSDSYD